MAKTHETNLTEGRIFRTLLLYALPLVATNLLQILFNTMDVAVLGAFVEDSDRAVAAVGATTALINLIVGLFVGLSVGANVLVARCMGGKELDRSRRIVGTAILSSVILGVALLLIGVFGARTFLEWTKCDPDVIDMSEKYLKIYFLGMPIMMLYNFCASVLRAVGDTKRPFIYLSIAGVANVGLNIFSVTVLGLDVEGVAIATVVSQGISTVLAVIALLKSDGFSKLEIKRLRIDWREFWEIVKIGVPAGLQGCMFSLANVVIQSSVNAFGKTVMAANTIGMQYQGFMYNAISAVSVAALSFVSQNLGARKMDRVKRCTWIAIGLALLVWLAIGGPILILARPLCGIMSDSPEVIRLACKRLYIIGISYTFGVVMDVFGSVIRGLGKSTTSMLICLSGSCLFRLLWVKTVCVRFPTIEAIWWVYLVSWVLTAGIYLVVYFPILKRTEAWLFADGKEENTEAKETASNGDDRKNEEGMA
ncbi:MAG: MATE family efflux transporter [Clostridia bacterium]|nr:MATE family efflux transporter [Clostridia bacterium]